MKIISINIALPKTIEVNESSVTTGIFKTATTEKIMARKLNFDGDGQADLENHGGEYKAIYGYPYEHYATWQSELERNDFEYGQFGENITSEGLLEDEIYIGNIYRFGEALLQITQPRVPCFKLGIRMNNRKIVKQFKEKERPGYYMRVLEEGMVQAGDKITLEHEDVHQVSVKALFHAYFVGIDDALAQKAIQIEGLAPGWRNSLQEQLAK